MGCGKSKHATATDNTAISKKSSSSRTNSKKETAPFVQQQEAAGNAAEKGDIHIVKEGEGEKALEGEKCADQGKESEKGETAAEEAKESKNGEAVGGAKETIVKGKVEEKGSIPGKDEKVTNKNGAQDKEGSLDQKKTDEQNGLLPQSNHL